MPCRLQENHEAVIGRNLAGAEMLVKIAVISKSFSEPLDRIGFDRVPISLHLRFIAAWISTNSQHRHARATDLTQIMVAAREHLRRHSHFLERHLTAAVA